MSGGSSDALPHHPAQSRGIEASFLDSPDTADVNKHLNLDPSDRLAFSWSPVIYTMFHSTLIELSDKLPDIYIMNIFFLISSNTCQNNIVAELNI